MSYKKADWLKMCAALREAEEALQAVQAGASRDRLDTAIIALWRFAEYAVNVLLELAGQKPELRHRQADRIKELKAAALIQGDYHARLEQLSHYRLRAFYAGYSSERSVSYSPTNVQDCLATLQALQQEVDSLLRQRKKL